MSQTVGLQRVEGLITLFVSLLLYGSGGRSWWLFALLLLTPDISIAGYALGNRAGQLIYNIVHSYVLPLALAGLSYWFGHDLLLSLSLIWVAHIGLDRALGYGLKEAAGFKYTHLGMVGNRSKA